MKRGRRNFMTIASTAMFVLFLVLWWLSFSSNTSCRWVVSADDFYVLRLQFGIVELDHTVCSSRNLPADWSPRYVVQTMPQGLAVKWNQRCKSVFGLGIRNEPLLFPMGNAVVAATTYGQSLPLWLLTFIAALLPLRRIVQWYRLQLARLSACESCGYDLTGNTSGVCPECGTQTVGNLAANRTV